MGMTADLSEEKKNEDTIEIVGIVPATRNALFEKEPTGAIYLPFARGFQSDVNFYIRFRSFAAGSEANTADLLRRAVREVDPAIPILSLKSFAQHLDSILQLWVVRAGAILCSVFCALALCFVVFVLLFASLFVALYISFCLSLLLSAVLVLSIAERPFPF